MPTDLTALEEELLEAWERNLPGQRQLGAALLARYAEPHRRYHTTEHLAMVLRRIEEFADQDHDLFLVRLAAWFHDAVYAVPEGQVSNEEASARLTIRELGRTGLEQEDLNEVARLVRVTATHQPSSQDRNGDLLCDADLAILAAPAEEYRRYVEDITAEYAHVDRLDFILGRHDLLTTLSDGDIFRTAKGRRLLPQARTNLETELAALERQYRDLAGDQAAEDLWQERR
ncbi:hypothetical protein GCM10009841_01220 [Microlunatus panaciterrae]|uniref:Metal-dependent HD superfamily phosphohydrolase n=1 Tax=Microlunatus panaciterrae TaxID=400768 RepID=A0ABS2RMN8_9ACTN|nr:metal-dependent phosphohydrolase [Microlunatus panaciterrae]MBM7799204.1 putative metal-dependent HD superfamily phosphohydrolase [Microlunatus panaciterrae]